MLITQISSELAKTYYVKTLSSYILIIIKFNSPIDDDELVKIQDKYNIELKERETKGYTQNGTPCVFSYKFKFTP